MREKEYKVLKYLSEQKDWTTAAVIGAAVGSSVRSIKTYIRNINEEAPELIHSSRAGFFIPDKKRLSSIIEDSTGEVPQTAQGRKAYILKKLLIENQSKDLDVLAEELCISPATLANEITAVKTKLIPFELVFRTKNNEAFIEGPEKNKKKMISHLIFEESKDFFTSLEILQTYIPHYDLKAVRAIAADALNGQQLFMDDFSLLNFILHIGITMERSRSVDHSRDNGIEAADMNSSASVPGHINSLLDRITADLGEKYKVSFSENERYDLSLILMTRIVHESIPEEKEVYLDKVVGEDIHELVTHIHHKVMHVFSLDINNHDFLMRFALHLRNLIIRLEKKIILRNPQMLNIKNTYPYIYEVSVFIADIIARKYGSRISDDEIAYIALHIGVLVEEQKAMKDKVKILLLSPKYYSSELKLAERIRDAFMESALLSHIITTPDELSSCSDYDCILSTINIAEFPGVPFLLISNYFQPKDIGNIAELIDQIKKSRMKEKLENKLKFLFKKELFFFRTEPYTRDQIIDQMAEVLQRQGYVNEHYREKIYEREAISSSAYANIAMPHPLDMNSETTAIAVFIYPPGTDWGGNKVNIVFMLAIDAEDRLLFRDIFDFVTEIIADEKYMLAVLNTKTYEEFIRLLVSFA